MWWWSAVALAVVTLPATPIQVSIRLLQRLTARRAPYGTNTDTGVLVTGVNILICRVGIDHPPREEGCRR